MTDTPNTAIMAALIKPTVRRRRTTRRPIRLQNRPYNKKRRPKVRPRPKRELLWTESQTESLYYTLIHFSEGYTNYHTLNYKFINSTFDGDF